MSVVKKTLLDFIGNKMFTEVRIASVESVSPHFKMIELESEAFKTASWSAGEKVQINTGEWKLRTYTPISIDTAMGRMKILIFLREDSAASNWARKVKVGDSNRVFGPRASLKFTEASPTILFGDETSFAVASTVRTFINGKFPVKTVFEVQSLEESQRVLDKLGLEDVVLLSKRPDGSHLVAVRDFIQKISEENPGTRSVLVGSAQSIQMLRALLKDAGFALGKSLIKAYWSLGKEGID